MAFPEHAEEQPAQRGERALPLGTLPYGLGDQLDRLGIAVEEQVLLAGEVVEDGLGRDFGRLGDLGDRDVVEPALHEQAEATSEMSERVCRFFRSRSPRVSVTLLTLVAKNL